MKITKKYLLQMIKEEIKKTRNLREQAGALGTNRRFLKPKKRHQKKAKGKAKATGQAGERCVDGKINYYRDGELVGKVPCCKTRDDEFMDKPCPEKGKEYPATSK